MLKKSSNVNIFIRKLTKITLIMIILIEIPSFYLTYSSISPNFRIIKSIKTLLIDKFTMIIPSYHERIDILRTFLNFTLNKPPKFLYEIIINWSSDKEEIEELINGFKKQNLKEKIPVNYKIYTDTSVNKRFLNGTNIKTEAILSIDDDILMSRKNLDFGYQIWKSHQKQIVGFEKRNIKVIEQNSTQILKYSFAGQVPRLILTSIAFLNRNLAIDYYNENNRENYEFVKKLNNCEDILMNFVAMNKFNLSNIWIKRRYKHLGVKGVSTKRNHVKMRSLCLNQFYKFFHHYPQPISKENIFK